MSNYDDDDLECLKIHLGSRFRRNDSDSSDADCGEFDDEYEFWKPTPIPPEIIRQNAIYRPPSPSNTFVEKFEEKGAMVKTESSVDDISNTVNTFNQKVRRLMEQQRKVYGHNIKVSINYVGRLLRFLHKVRKFENDINIFEKQMKIREHHFESQVLLSKFYAFLVSECLLVGNALTRRDYYLRKIHSHFEKKLNFAKIEEILHFRNSMHSSELTEYFKTDCQFDINLSNDEIIEMIHWIDRDSMSGNQKDQSINISGASVQNVAMGWKEEKQEPSTPTKECPVKQPGNKEMKNKGQNENIAKQENLSQNFSRNTLEQDKKQTTCKIRTFNALQTESDSKSEIINSQWSEGSDFVCHSNYPVNEVEMNFFMVFHEIEQALNKISSFSSLNANEAASDDLQAEFLSRQYFLPNTPLSIISSTHNDDSNNLKVEFNSGKKKKQDSSALGEPFDNTSLEKTEDFQRFMLMTSLGSHGQKENSDIFGAFHLSDDENRSIEELKEKSDFFESHVNYERNAFPMQIEMNTSKYAIMMKQNLNYVRNEDKSVNDKQKRQKKSRSKVDEILDALSLEVMKFVCNLM